MIPSDILAAVRRIEIKTKSLIDSMMGGEYRTVFKGTGMEFAEVRQYEAGDDIRSIDWNVTARIGEPYIKRNMEERELTVILAIDVSGSGDFGTSKQFKSEMIAELGALLGFSAIRNNDKVGLLLFSDRVEKFIPPKKGRNHVLHLVRELLYFKPEGRGTDIEKALAHLNMIQKKKCVTFLISDFRDSNYEKALLVTAKRHDLIAISTDDEREYDLPNMGMLELEDGETGERILVDSSSRRVREEYKKLGETRRESLDEMFKAKGIDHLTITTKTGYVDPLVKFFQMRERKR
jgi:uncharacterized protein (DUF58 family)